MATRRADDCDYCGMPSEMMHSRVNEPLRSLCRPCYQHMQRDMMRGRRSLEEVEVGDILGERPLSRDEMVAELLEIREATDGERQH